MLTLLGQENATPFGEQISNGIVDIEDLTLSDLQKCFLSLKRKQIFPNLFQILYQEQT